MRLIVCLALFALMPPALAGGKDNGGSQFIDRSVVTYPKSLGHYSLVSGSYDPANVASGVSLNYRLADAPPGLQFNIYVYPLGRVDTPKAVADATVEIEGEIRAMEQKKIYADVKFDEPVDFEVVVPPASILKSGKEKAVSPAVSDAADSPKPADPDSRAIEEALRASEPPKSTTGRKRALAFTVRDEPAQSLAYVFYRNLFLISVRATAPVKAMPADQFNALVDGAVRDLVPAMDIKNFGKCGTIEVAFDPKSSGKQKDGLSGALQIVQGMGRIQRENCANMPDPADAPAADQEQQTIVYPAGTWK